MSMSKGVRICPSRCRLLTLDRGSDLRALSMALDRYEGNLPTLADILVPGPLPGTDEELSAYLDMCRRGLDEVRSFLNILV
jgi:hypothetical protein